VDDQQKIKIYETEQYQRLQSGHTEPGADNSPGENDARHGIEIAFPYVFLQDWVLNIGCQTGVEMEKLAERGIRNVIGLDLFPEHAYAKGLVVVRTDMHHLPFGDEAFDFVYSRDTLEHSPEPDRVLKETWRVLRPGKQALFSVPVLHEAPYHFTVLDVLGWRALFSAIFPCYTELRADNQYIVLLRRVPASPAAYEEASPLGKEEK
jgi:SAM-dependent methyltransferase